LIGIAHENNVSSLIDAQNAFIAEAIDGRPDIAKMNWEEFEWTFGYKADSIESLYQQAKQFKRERKVKNLILTLSKDGILALTSEGNYLAKAPLQKPVNAAGAGDAVSSTIVWRLSLGDNWVETLHWASAVSAAAVLTKRTGDINMEDVHRIYKDVDIQKLD
jgi:fructose-1-phosphate kinase PfkB-like protein